MYCVVVVFEVAPQHLKAFAARMVQQADDSLQKEIGCRTFDVWVGTDAPDTIVLHEIYDDKTAFDAHLASEHFAAFSAEVAPMIRSKRVYQLDQRISLDKPQSQPTDASD